MRNVKPFEGMTDEELVAKGVSTGKSLSLTRLAISNNERSGFGETQNTHRQRLDEASYTQVLTEVNKHLAARDLPTEDIENVVEKYGYAASVYPG